MRIRNLFTPGAVYSSNVYLVTGTWNALADVNTLVDVGRDEAILARLMEASTGVGKHRVEQVVLTHSHYDHTSLLSRIRDLFNPVVYAASASFPGVDVILKGGEQLRFGDRMFEVIRTPGHSNDSLCFFCAEDGVLFAGDTPLIIRSPEGSFVPEFADALKSLANRDIRCICFGHGLPLREHCNAAIKKSLENVRASRLAMQRPQDPV